MFDAQNKGCRFKNVSFYILLLRLDTLVIRTLRKWNLKQQKRLVIMTLMNENIKLQAVLAIGDKNV